MNARITDIKPANAEGEIMTPNHANVSPDDALGKESEIVIVTNQSRVACNGGGGSLGHPQIFLSLGNDGKVTCPYCSRVFIKAAN